MKIFKLFVSIALILSISLINSFAAISVSDGSAFVTKAEFAADLNNLSNRMSTLENSLDAKIDSLVSSYLSRNGIWNGEKQEINDTNKKITFPTPKLLGSNASASLAGVTTSSKVELFKPSKSGLAYLRTSVVSTLGNSFKSYWGYICKARNSGKKNLYDDALNISVEFSDSSGVLSTLTLHNGSSTIRGFETTTEGIREQGDFILVFTIPGSKQYSNIQFFIEKDKEISWQFKATARHGYNTSEEVSSGSGEIELISAVVY